MVSSTPKQASSAIFNQKKLRIPLKYMTISRILSLKWKNYFENFLKVSIKMCLVRKKDARIDAVTFLPVVCNEWTL